MKLYAELCSTVMLDIVVCERVKLVGRFWNVATVAAVQCLDSCSKLVCESSIARSDVYDTTSELYVYVYMHTVLIIEVSWDSGSETLFR